MTGIAAEVMPKAWWVERLKQQEALTDAAKAEIEAMKFDIGEYQASLTAESNARIAAEAELADCRVAAGVDEAYQELIYAVGNKYPDESRHETALRYIKAAEAYMPNASTVAPTGAKP